jgi:hypothetical protein
MNKEKLKPCNCGGEGHHFCHDSSNEIGKEGYSVVCEDCGQRSEESLTWQGATSAWNKKQHQARLREKSNRVSQKMIDMGRSPLPLWVQTQSINDLTDQ